MKAEVLDTVLVPGKGVDAQTGAIIDAPDCFTSWEPVLLGAGSAISPVRPGITLEVSCYSPGFNETLARTYTYNAESNWTTFMPGAGPVGPLDDPASPWVCPAACYVRITARCSDGTSPSVLGDVAAIEVAAVQDEPLPPALEAEIERVCARVEELRDPGDLALILLSDIHYATGCIWPTTARCVHAVAERIAPQAIVQLGDITDGVAPARVTAQLVNRVLGGLYSCGAPVLGCVGNHDANYFKGNDERLTSAEAARMCTGRGELWYAVDFPEQQVRCLFLKSYEAGRAERYGYELDQIRWVHRQLRAMPRGWKALVFSHMTLYAQIHWWSDTVLGEKLLTHVLDRFNRLHRGAIAGFIHGHSHADQIFCKDSFPDIGIGCAKFEDFTDYKPYGSVTPERSLDDESRELWDVLILKHEENRIELVRFGAGEDRSVTCYDRAR